MSNYHVVYFGNAGVPATALTPTWNTLKNVADGTAYTPQPTITEIGGGWYKFQLDLDAPSHVVGAIDGGVTLADADRYKSIDIRYSAFSASEHKEIVVTPVYDEDTLTLTFMVFLLVNGEVVKTGLSSLSLAVYNESHVLQFTLTTNSFTNGVALVSQNSPTLTKNRTYYALATITTTVETIESAEAYLTLE